MKARIKMSTPPRWIRMAIPFVIFLTSLQAGALAQDLIVHYPLDGDAKDASGNGHDGTVQGAVPVSDRFGNPSGALRFDGGDHVSLADHPDLAFGSDSITMMAWVQRTQASSDGGYYMMGQSNGGGNNAKWIFFLGNNGLSLIMYPASGSHWHGCGSYSFVTGTWYHVAIRKNGSEITGFVDGAPIGSNSGAPASFGDPSKPLYLGTAEGGHPGRVLRGDLDDVRIYRRALSNAEIENIYEGSIGQNYCAPAEENSSGLPGIIAAFGSAIVVDNDLTLAAEQLAANEFGYFLNSQTQGFVANPGGSQGNLCLAGAIGRHLSSLGDTGPTGALSAVIDLTSLPTPTGPYSAMAGESWNFQAWFRDTNPGSTSNFTDAVSIMFE